MGQLNRFLNARMWIIQYFTTRDQLLNFNILGQWNCLWKLNHVKAMHSDSLQTLTCNTLHNLFQVDTENLVIRNRDNSYVRSVQHHRNNFIYLWSIVIKLYSNYQLFPLNMIDTAVMNMQRWKIVIYKQYMSSFAFVITLTVPFASGTHTLSTTNMD